ncbi:MAG TPA: hypothetical protein VIH99_05045 [Bdellovibrionota bacterium]|jgi:hypothetical protein
MDALSLHGFSLIRNGLKYDYPFRESLGALRLLCDSVVVAVGRSEDGTEQELARLNLEQVPTIWDEQKRQGGVILSEQTNIALNELRRRHPKGWGFYLQADELISEQDFARIRQDLVEAERLDCDCISFRYLHFWQSYERICVGKRWYPQEIRAIRLDRSIESYGDAQSFRGWKKKFESDAVIYHYGHVREAAAYEKKKNDFHRWWHPDADLAQVIARGEKDDRHEETVTYLGPHPALMDSRIGIQGGLSRPGRESVKVFGDPRDYSRDFLDRVQATLEWSQDERVILKEKTEDVVWLRPVSFLGRVLSFGAQRSTVPEKMASPQARPWSKEFQALLRFSERGVRLR